MTEKEVSRYIDLVHRKTHILAHSGVDWKPEYGLEMEGRREQWQENLTFP